MTEHAGRTLTCRAATLCGLSPLKTSNFPSEVSRLEDSLHVLIFHNTDALFSRRIAARSCRGHMQLADKPQAVSDRRWPTLPSMSGQWEVLSASLTHMHSTRLTHIVQQYGCCCCCCALIINKLVHIFPGISLGSQALFQVTVKSKCTNPSLLWILYVYKTRRSLKKHFWWQRQQRFSCLQY